MTLGLAVILISIFCVISIDKIYSLTIPVGLLPTITGLRPRLSYIPIPTGVLFENRRITKKKGHWQTISLPRQCEFQMPDSTYLAGPFPSHFLLLRWLLISLQETFFRHIQSFFVDFLNGTLWLINYDLFILAVRWSLYSKQSIDPHILKGQENWSNI